MKPNKRIAIFVLVAVLLAVLAAVGIIQYREDAPRASTSVPEKREPVKVGVVVPLTGPGAPLGELIKRGIQLGDEDVRGAERQPRLQFLFQDSKTSPKDGLAAYRHLRDVEKVDVAIVAFSTVCNAVAPAAESDRVLMIGTTTSMPGLTTGRQFVIRSFPNADMLAGTMADYAAKNFKRLAILYVEDEYGRTTFTTFKERLLNKGSAVVFSEGFPATQSEFRSLVDKMLEASPDAIYIPGYGPSYIALLKAIRERNAGIAILGDSPLSNPSVYRAAGQAVEGAIIPATDLDAGIARTDAQRRFLERYKARFSENPSINVSVNFDLVHILSEAMMKGEATPHALRSYFVSNSPFQGITGNLSWDASGESTVVVKPMVIKGGTIKTLP
jgi:branched-chain amino acid transport system substrate-binding protein